MTRAHREGGKAKRKRAELSFPPGGANLARARPQWLRAQPVPRGAGSSARPASLRALTTRPSRARRSRRGTGSGSRPARPRSARPRSLTMVRRLAGSRPSPARPPPSRPPRSGEAGPHRAFPQCPERNSRHLLPPCRERPGARPGPGRAGAGAGLCTPTAPVLPGQLRRARTCCPGRA